MSNQDSQRAAHSAPEVEQEVESIHVPRGRSRARYVLTIFLLIFILVIFVVSDLFQGAFSRSGRDEGPFVEWNHPRLGQRSIGYTDFVLERRRVEDFYRVLGVDRRQLRELTSDENIARTLIVDELAVEAGVEFTDTELRSFVKDRFNDSATYTQALSAAGVAPTDFQSVLRRMLRTQRYESILSDLAAQPQSAEIEKAWKEQHKQHSLELVTFRVDLDDPQLVANLPDQAGLSTWYDGLDALRKRQMFSAEWRPERAAAELAYFDFQSGDSSALVARYPLAEGQELEQLGRDFHSQFAHVRFRRPEEKADAVDARERLYFTYEEVSERAKSEARAHAAMLAFAAELRSQHSAAGAVDVAGQAVALGLAFVREAAAKSQPDWSAMAVVGSPMLSDAVMRASRGDKFVGALVTDKLLLVGRVTERLEAGPPAFVEIAARVEEEWRKDQAYEVARKASLALVEACKPPLVEGVQPQPSADAESFAAKAGEVGRAAELVDWFDQADLPTDVSADEPDTQHFLRELKLGARSAITSVEGAVMGPYTATDKQRVFVSRYIGNREPPVIEIEPREFRGLQANALRQSQQTFSEQVFGKAGLERNFGLRFPGRVEAPQGEEALPPADGQG